MRHTSITRLGAIGLASAALFLAACSDDPEEGGSGSGTEETTGGADTTLPAEGGGGEAGAIEIADFAFSEASAAAGATVAVSNVDGTTHTVTSDDDAWEEASVDGGGSGEFTAPAEAGEYAFHCRIHPTMSGTLVVE